MVTTTARYSTEHGPKYLQQLCKHFAHKVEVSFDEATGHVAFESGTAELTADATGLDFRIVAADAKAMIQLRFAIDVHLVTFAHREGFTGLSWAVLAD